MMKRILIIGATGMLGHKMALKLSAKHTVFATVRKNKPHFFEQNTNGNLTIIEGIDVFYIDTIRKAIEETKPDYVLNCVGIVKQLAEAKNPITSITINALFPHQLEKMAEDLGYRLFHFSTDCVFSGKQGPYKQSDPSDVNDLYGMTKFLGEVRGPRALTIRSSIIGREFVNPTGLIEWFLSQKGQTVKGFKHALYTGLTTNSMADLIGFIIEKHPTLSGLYHVASEEISKYELLRLVNEIAQTHINIVPDDVFYCDRRLIMDEFHKITGWVPESWEKMLKSMFKEDSQYYITTS